MIAYNNKWLDNIQAEEELSMALDQGSITEKEKAAAVKLYPLGFYTPNFFIRIGLYVLTIIIVCSALGIMALLAIQGGEKSFGGILIFFGLAGLAMLEVMVKQKHHYCSGVDDALLLMGPVLVTSGLNLIASIPSITNALVILIFSMYGVIRYADKLMTVIAHLSLLAFVFFLQKPMGNTVKAVLPFILMAINAAIYFIIQRIKQFNSLRHYSGCFIIASITALTCFYISGNYFAVREASASFFQLNFKVGESIPLGWLFWLFTASVPLIYIACGINNRDIILIRVGLLLIAGTVFTVRYYYSVMPAETAMIIAGVIMMVISFMLQRLLRQPRGGFIAAELSHKRNEVLDNLESIIIAETLGKAQGSGQPSNKFGGGDFGGGGASGNY